MRWLKKWFRWRDRSAASDPRARGDDLQLPSLCQDTAILPCSRCAAAPETKFSPAAATILLPLPLSRLPHEAATAVASFLDLETLAVVCACCDCQESTTGSAMYIVFVHRSAVRIPPDAARSQPLLQLINHPDTLRMIGSQFIVVDTYHLHPLRNFRNRVSALTVHTGGQYVAWPDLPVQCVAFTLFPRLTRLEIGCARHHGIDLSELVQCAPQLQQLTIKNAYHLTNTLCGLHLLRDLWLENTNIESFSIAVGLASLTSLTLLTGRRPLWRPVRGAASLASVAPLTSLVVRGDWAESPHSGLRKHRATLHTFVIRDFTNYYYNTHHQWRVRVHASMAQLRSLRLGRHAYRDLRPLMALPQLEDLQVAVSDSATHCRPLQTLTKLRTLQITRGWLCDIVGFLPRLHTLVCDEDVNQHGHRRARLGRRASDYCASSAGGGGSGGRAELQTLVLRGNFTIDGDDPVVQTLLHRVVQLEMWRCYDLDQFLPSITSLLPHLRRLAVLDCFVSRTTWDTPLLDASHGLGDARILEELYMDMTNTLDYLDCRPGLAGAPSEFLMRLPQLRVLACRHGVALSTIASLCPKLTQFLVPFSTNGDFSLLSNGQTLQFLRVVSLPAAQSCGPLRRARGSGRALPVLQCIRHPVADCLWAPHCPLAGGVEKPFCLGDYWKYVQGHVLRPPWAWGFEPKCSSNEYE